VVLGNDVLLECRVPPHVADVVFVASWLIREHGFPDIDLLSSDSGAQGLLNAAYNIIMSSCNAYPKAY
jgi:hypothetical protein